MLESIRVLSSWFPALVSLSGDSFYLSAPPKDYWERFMETFRDTRLVGKPEQENAGILLDVFSNGLWTTDGEELDPDKDYWIYYRPILIPLQKDLKTIDQTWGKENPDGLTYSGGYLLFRKKSPEEEKIYLGHVSESRTGPSIDLENFRSVSLVDSASKDILYLGCDDELKWISFEGCLLCWDWVVAMRLSHMRGSLIPNGPWFESLPF